MSVLHSCKDCILDGESLSYDHPVKLQDHEKQKTHRMVEQAYERGVQQGRKFAEDEAKHAAHLAAGSCAQEPQEPMMARWLYIQAFEDGKQAAQDEHNLVMKAMVETHNAQLDVVFKRGQDYKAMAGEAPELEPYEHASSATPTVAADPVAPYVNDPLASPASHASTSQLEPQPEEGAQLACPTPEEPTNQLELLPEEGGQLTFQTPREPLSQLALHPEQGVHLLFNHTASLNLQPALQQEEELTSLAQPELQPHPEIKPGAVQRDAHEQSPPQEQATSSALESTGDIFSVPRYVKEKYVIKLKCIIKNACGIGGYASQKVCRCPNNGRLQTLYLGEWQPMTDSERLTADAHRLLDILHDCRDLANVDDRIKTHTWPCTPEQQSLLQMCSDATDVHHIDYDPQQALTVAYRLLKYVPDQPPCECVVTAPKPLKGKQSNRTSNMFGKR
ncbi:TPA: hypothetical protein ACH3X3_011351 [Trebouxia sp. C0006]